MPESQDVELTSGASVRLTRDEGGAWRVGETEVVENGYRYAFDDSDFILEFTGGRWRRALYTIRTVAGHTDAIDGGLATSARLLGPLAVGFDALSNAYNRRLL